MLALPTPPRYASGFREDSDKTLEGLGVKKMKNLLNHDKAPDMFRKIAEAMFINPFFDSQFGFKEKNDRKQFNDEVEEAMEEDLLGRNKFIPSSIIDKENKRDYPHK